MNLENFKISKNDQFRPIFGQKLVHDRTGFVSIGWVEIGQDAHKVLYFNGYVLQVL